MQNSSDAVLPIFIDWSDIIMLYIYTQKSDAEKNGKHKKNFPGKIYTRFCHLNAI